MGKCSPEGVQVLVIFRPRARRALSKFSGRPGSIFGSILGGLLGAFSVHNFVNIEKEAFLKASKTRCHGGPFSEPFLDEF